MSDIHTELEGRLIQKHFIGHTADAETNRYILYILVMKHDDNETPSLTDAGWRANRETRGRITGKFAASLRYGRSGDGSNGSIFLFKAKLRCVLIR